MNERDMEIRQDNKKALPKFVIKMVLCCLGGGVIGFLAAYFGADRLAGVLAAAGDWFGRNLAPWLLAACAAASLAVGLPLYARTRALANRWDGEDMDAYDRIDRQLTRNQKINSFLLIASFFLLAASYAGGFGDGEKAPSRFVGMAVAIVSFFVLIIAQLRLSQKTVDLTKKLCPEKRGSVYDRNFQAQWLDSCDEAERALIGQCAYRAYRAVNLACVILWCVFTVAALFLNTGLLPPLAVCILWGVSNGTYLHWAGKLPGIPAAGGVSAP